MRVAGTLLIPFIEINIPCLNILNIYKLYVCKFLYITVYRKEGKMNPVSINREFGDYSMKTKGSRQKFVCN
jgi:hypothetical protein